MLPKQYYSSPRLLEVTIPFILCISSQLTKTPALSKRNKNPCRIHERLTEDWRHALLALWFIQLKLSHHCTTHTLNRMAVPLRKTQLLSWLLLQIVGRLGSLEITQESRGFAINVPKKRIRKITTLEEDTGNRCPLESKSRENRNIQNGRKQRAESRMMRNYLNRMSSKVRKFWIV